MTFYVLRKLLEGALVIMVVTFLAFFIFQYLGDPVSQMTGMDTTAAERAVIRENLGLNDSFVVQYGHFLWKAVHGDFGLSYQFKRPVIDLIAESFPATVELVIVSTLFALLLGTGLGIATALFRDTWLTRFLLTLSVFGVALPTFLISIAVIYIFSVTLGWLPSYGRGATINIGGWTSGLFSTSGLKSLVLPTFSLAVYQMALIMRLVRSEMSEILRADYIRFAKARGIAPFSLYFVHALRNALIPVTTIVGLQLGSLIGFSIITEMVFQWPGMGLLFLQSIQNVDLPVLSAYMMIVSAIIIAINTAVDLLYAVFDPRIRAAR